MRPRSIPGHRDISHNTPPHLRALGGIRAFGFGVLLLLVGGFGVWAATAPIAGAVIVEGQVVAAGRNVVVQHLEGGIVAEVLIVEGERVKANQALFIMDDAPARTQMRRLQRQAIGRRAQLARLQAERDQAEELTFANELVAQARMLDAMDLIDEQLAEWRARRERQQSEAQILSKRIVSQEGAIQGFESQMAALTEQIDIISEEVDRKRALLERGLTQRSEYTELLRANASLVGQRGSLAGQIEASRAQLLQAEEEIVRLQTSAVEQAATQINQSRLELSDVYERIQLARDTLERVTIRSEVDGIVVQMAVRSPGSVVRPGNPLATILPTQDDLIIDGRMALQDIDLIAPGQAAALQFLALNQRVTPSVPAEVIFVSPDALTDDVTGEPYYAVRLRPTELPPEVKVEDIFPGMPVSALVSTPDRTFFEYLAKPVTDSFRLAFREQ